MRNKKAKVSDPNSFHTCCGSPVHIRYGSRLLDDGTVELYESGRDDIQEMMQADVCNSDIHVMLTRLSQGDASVLNPNPPIYGDFTVAPRTLADAWNMSRDARSVFDHLPVEVKARFDNSVEKWFATAGSDEWNSKMNVGDSSGAAVDLDKPAAASDNKDGV